MEYAERLNYRPNPIALSLKGSSSKAIAGIVPQIANNFFSQAINGIEAIAYWGYHVIIFQTHESYEREIANVQQAVSRRVDGLLSHSPAKPRMWPTSRPWSTKACRWCCSTAWRLGSTVRAGIAS